MRVLIHVLASQVSAGNGASHSDVNVCIYTDAKVNERRRCRRVASKDAHNRTQEKTRSSVLVPASTIRTKYTRL
eukprot:1493710-Pleurochrysis_carterae.AAC.1